MLKPNSMTKKYLFLTAVILSLFSFKSDKRAFVLFNAEGKEVQYSKLLEAVKDADVILFGELHDNPIVHWLQQELTKDLHASKKENLILGAEMFEADDQIVLDEYLSGLITEKTFKEEAKVWTNYTSDYKPLLDFAKKNKLKFVALHAHAKEQLTIIDVRNPEEYAALHIPGAINIPLQELEDRSIELSKKNIIVTACGKGGGRSARGAALLKQIGFNRANYLCGGTFGWFEAL